VDIILGLLEPVKGCLTVDGVELHAESFRQWQATLGYVPQDIYLLDDTIARNIALGVRRTDIDMKKVREAARIANIHEFINRLPRKYQTFVGERGKGLSGGQRQQIGIARALYRNPSLLVLDEATSALDTITERNVLRSVLGERQLRTVIMIAHRLTPMAALDSVCVLDQGRLINQGSYTELLKSCPQFSAMANSSIAG
jgi:ATP-binding cassette subfamily C protein